MLHIKAAAATNNRPARLLCLQESEVSMDATNCPVGKAKQGVKGAIWRLQRLVHVVRFTHLYSTQSGWGWSDGGRGSVGGVFFVLANRIAFFRV
jgi:hypothetical protein